MRSFYFIRHGQTNWNLEGRFQGNADIPLNKEGKSQAQHAAKLFAGIELDHIISSPMARAEDTAKIIAEQQKNAQLSTHSLLKERCYGSFEGEKKEDLVKKLGLKNANNIHAYLPEDAETEQACYTRITQALEEIWQNFNGTVLLVSHGGIFRRLHEHLLQTPQNSSNAVPYHFIYQNGIWRCEQQPITTQFNKIAS